MFGLFRNKKIKVCSPVSGESIDLSEVNDAAFREEMLGKVVAVRPTDSRIFSPVKGEVTMIFKTLHAIGVKGENGEELLIHIGLDTVALNGEGFDCHVQVGDKVDTDSVLMNVDFEFIDSKGLDTVVLIILTNSDKFSNFDKVKGNMKHGEKIFSFK